MVAAKWCGSEKVIQYWSRYFVNFIDDSQVL